MRSTDPVLSARGRLARMSRFGGDLDAARGDLTEAKLARHIAEALASDPPLSAAQRDRLASLLRPEGQH
jgi:hypothetical protein